MSARRIVSLAVVLFLCSPAAAQLWTGNAGNGNWNTGANWSGGTFPNSPTAQVSFFLSGTGPVNISASVQAQSLTFTNPTGNYTLTSGAGQTLSGVTDITVGSGVNSRATSLYGFRIGSTCWTPG